MTAPLHDITVLDVSQSVGAAFATSLLAEFGATVMMIEPPSQGSAVRRAVDPAARDAWWQYIGRNKRSIRLDASSPESAPQIEALLARSDILVTDASPGDWSLDPWLQRIGEGTRAPLVLDLFATGTDRPDLWNEGMLAEFTPALTGMMNMTGWPDGPPASVEAPVAEYLAAMMGAMGVLAELRARRRGHAASHVRLATHEAVQRMIEWQLPIAALTGDTPRRNGNNFPMNAGISNMPVTRDGLHVTFSAASEDVATRLLRMIGGEDLARDPLFATAQARRTNMDALYRRIDDWCAERTRADILSSAAAADVVAGPIHSARDIAEDPELADRRNLVRHAGADGREFVSSATVPRVKGMPHAAFRAAPALGQDDELLSSILQAHRSGSPAARDGSTVSHATDAGDRGSLPLAGVVVIELGTIIAGPFAGSLLSDLGATVIKIENPKHPDGLRLSGAKIEGLSIWWGVQARNKKCISLDLKHPLGRATFQKLIAKADVLIENFRPGTLAKLGLPVESLQVIKPDLTVLSISGYGHDVRHSHKPGFGKIAEGLSGMLPLTGDPGRPPLFTGFSLADASTGLMGALSICMMLLGPKAGAQIDLALYESLLRMMEFQFHRLDDGEPPVRKGHNHPYGWGYDLAVKMPCVRCADGVWIQLSIKHEDRPPAPAPDWPTWAQHRPHQDALHDLMQLRIPAVAVRDGASIAADPYFRARGDVEAAYHPLLGHFPVTGFFPKRARAADVERFNAAALGEPNDWVFRDFLGLSADDHGALKREGVI